MRADLFHVTVSSTLAQLRRAMAFHHARTAPEGARTATPQRKPAGAIVRCAAPDGSRSLTERHLQVLGVGQPPDRA